MKLKIYLTVKRLIDVVLSFLGLILASPVLIPIIFLVWRQDKHSPFYVAERIGRNFKPFMMVKLRSMIKNADSAGVDSTSVNDMRITPIGQIIRKYKLDELTQLWNVLVGDMSLVGPRPNVRRETDLYTSEERRLLSAKPGITDFASIVFSDEGDILANESDPDIAYNQLIRPGKSELGLVYIQTQKLWVDFSLVIITAIALISRKKSLRLNWKLLQMLKVPNHLVLIAKRESQLLPSPPPGSNTIVTSRVNNE